MSRASRGQTSVHVLLVLGPLLVLAGFLVHDYVALEQSIVEERLRKDLAALREAVARFQEEHPGVTPGVAHGEARESRFVHHLARKTLPDGQPDPAGSCGPYLGAGIPPNPINGLDSVLLTTDDRPNDSTGWLFHLPTGRVYANCTGLGADGALFDY